ncbi:DNA-binding protein [Nocardioides glacieisoli]|uniref:DNA-binding protein n=1 Tax=Nocardioides glacieisoli TaxID=1168730 RepID=A0A4Q2RQS1_9ACTN|nr:DNA-binding protein [Nocardioides glacieisoli]
MPVLKIFSVYPVLLPDFVPIDPHMESNRTGAGVEADEPMISIAGLAAWLGVSDHAVKKWVQAGPAAGRVPRMYRINGQVRFRPAEVRVWIESKAIG